MKPEPAPSSWHRRTRRLVRRAALATALVVTVGLLPQAAAGDVPHLDPAALPRGADPGVAHLVRDTIRDGAATVPATRRGEHEGLWVVDGGYLLRDYNVGPRSAIRLVFISRSGERREVARSRDWIEVAVSPSGATYAYRRTSSPESLRSVVTVERPSGDVVATREMRLVNLVGLSRHRVLLGRRLLWHDPATVWWNFALGRVRRIHGQAATGADIRHDKVVFNTSSIGEFCNRVAVLSRPARTLWRSCEIVPRQWSPDGSRAIATRTYFDAAGTDRWWVVGGRTGVRRSRVAGRLDWRAVWEDDRHFLTLAQSDTGRAAIIRCDLAGDCERASRLWDVPVPADPSLFYDAPPVVLAER